MHFEIAALEGGYGDDEGTIGNRIIEVGKRRRASEEVGGSDRRAGFAESRIVGSDQAKLCEAEVGESAGAGADIQRIASAHENDTQSRQFRRIHAVGFSGAGRTARKSAKKRFAYSSSRVSTRAGSGERRMSPA